MSGNFRKEAQYLNFSEFIPLHNDSQWGATSRYGDALESESVEVNEQFKYMKTVELNELICF